MKIFGSLDTPMPPGFAHALVGRQVANASFLHALWRYGDFDAYHFFAGDRHDAALFLEAHAATIDALGLRDRVRVFTRFELLGALASTPYHVFHQSDFVTWFGQLCHLRSRHARPRFPVTAPIHSISYPAYLETYLRLMLVGPEPYDAVLCSSRAGRAAIEEAFRRVSRHPALAPLELNHKPRLELLPLGVDLERFSPPAPAERKAARQASGLSEDNVVVLCLGRFSESDKYDLLPLLRAFQEAVRDGSSAHALPLSQARLVLAGARQGSSYPERIEQVVGAMGLADRVSIRVDLTGEQQRQLYQSADLFVSPSDNLQETFGLTVVEAMAAGLPVVASDWDGYKDLIEDGVTGVRVPTWVGGWDEALGELGPVSYERPWHLAVAQSTIVDVPAMARALNELLVAPERRRAMGQAARTRAEQFAWPRIIAAHLELWRGLSEEAGRDTRPPPERSPFAQPPFGLFPFHPTGVLPDNARLSLTELGEAVLRTPEARPWYLELDALFDTDVVRHLCALARRGATVGDAVGEVADTRGAPSSDVAYQLAWMIKRDLIRAAIVRPEPS